MTEPGLNLEYSIAQTVAEGVQLTTAHSSKGLEYQAVLLYNTRYGHWGNRRGGGGLSLPDTLILGLDPNQKHEQQEDERRLFYVALTRAKQYLHCGYSATIRRNDSLQPTQPSAFVAEIGTQINEQAASNTLQPLEPFTLEIPDLSEEFKVYLKERLEQFELSVTALNAFLTDPQEFIWTHLLLQPRSKKAHLAYGTAVHSALETRSMAQKNNEEFGTDKLIDSFIDTMTRRELMTEKERDHYLHIGAIVLERYGNETSTAPLLLSTERSLKARLGDIPLTGKVDRIDLFELNGQNVRIVDYKTGTPKRTEAAIRKDENLFRQLVFYKLLADESPSFTHSATMFSLVFLGTEKQEPSTIDLSITEAEVTELKELIKKVWSKLENFDFTSIE
jgi:DNA helicase-2/ATP-dependent DNA helicase PcrA